MEIKKSIRKFVQNYVRYKQKAHAQIMKSSLHSYCKKRLAEFELISKDRRLELQKISAYIRYKETDPIDLVFISKDNSGNSQFAQVWAKVAASFYGFKNVETFSTGTDESTELSHNVVYTFMSLGFDLKVEGNENNARHFFVFDQRDNASICFSKTWNHYSLPKKEFGVIFTSSFAAQDCPIVDEAELVISTFHESPESTDGTSEAQQKYRACSDQIAREMMYVFSKSLK